MATGYTITPGYSSHHSMEEVEVTLRKHITYLLYDRDHTEALGMQMFNQGSISLTPAIYAAGEFLARYVSNSPIKWNQGDGLSIFFSSAGGDPERTHTEIAIRAIIAWLMSMMHKDTMDISVVVG